MTKTKNRSIYVCQTCGAQRPRWEGKCSDCGAWNSLVEESAQAAEPQGWLVQSAGAAGSNAVMTLDQDVSETTLERWQTKIAELDRVLGGGFVPGSFVLLGGDPGIGKSTLLLQATHHLGRAGLEVLYVSGEESTQQTTLRAHRLGIRNARVHVASESRLETILELVKKVQPKFLVIDSIQTVFWSELGSAPGTVGQVRECAARLMGLAKTTGTTVVLVGHVTKDGSLAGPKTLEHMVDCVLSFEGDSQYQFRILRSMKNRFGPAMEMGVFQMDEKGLIEVTNPSELFIQDRRSDTMGSVVFCSVEGTRPLLCEIQALTSASHLANPRRTAIGIDANRVHLIAAVLDKFLKLQLSESDIFVNVVGGLRIQDPAVDVAIAATLISTACQKDIPAKLCVFGEIGLTGEIRPVAFTPTRINEARKLGFEKFLIPLDKNSKEIEPKDQFHFLRSVKDLPEALAWTLTERTKQRSRKPQAEEFSSIS